MDEGFFIMSAGETFMHYQCSICMEGKLVEVRSIKSPFTSQEYKLYQCNSCQSRSFDVNEHPEVDLSRHYNMRSEDQEYLSSTFIASKYWSNEMALIKNIYAGTPESVLDVGCRAGDFLLHWPQNVKTMGVELSVHSADIAAKRGLDVRQDYLENVNFLGRFDVVTAYAILEHLARPQEFLGKVTSLVNPMGILVIMIPSYQTLKAKILETLNIRWHMYCPPEHLSLYSREFLDSYLEARGFTLAKRKYTSGGMFNPFQKIPLARSVFSKTMQLLDACSPLNRFPVFDHMYSYYKYSG
jgi:SAM-dependent methyltransferase